MEVLYRASLALGHQPNTEVDGAEAVKPVQTGGHIWPCVKTVATPTGFEPAISALTGQYVKPLHHGAAIKRAGQKVPLAFIAEATAPCNLVGK